jgi:phosphomannomutase
MQTIDPSIFKAYDIRGIYPDQLNEDSFYKIGQAYAKFLITRNGADNNAERHGNYQVVVGRDVRISGPSLFKSLTQGLTDHGVNVVDIGVITTDMMYFSVASYGYEGGLAITASHNPREYNGIKMVRAKGAPISGDSGIYQIRDLVMSNYKFQISNKGTITQKDVLEDYIKKVLSVIDPAKIKPFKVVANINFGPMGRNLKRLADLLSLEIIWLNEEPNGNFPKGRPDPLVPENRDEVVELVKRERPDLGVAWDSDADRCFFFDETGRFISGYFTTAILSKIMLERYPKGKVLVDSKLNWATIDLVKHLGGQTIMTRTGHSFIKQKMIEQDAVFGGEVSSHFYFKDFFYLDNGLIPFVLMLELLSTSGKKMSEIYRSLFEKYFAIDETNIKVSDVNEVVNGIKQKYSDGQLSEIDGVVVEYPDWRMSVRGSNTEPLLRLNMEAKTPGILKQKTEEVVNFINQIK